MAVFFQVRTGRPRSQLLLLLLSKCSFRRSGLRGYCAPTGLIGALALPASGAALYSILGEKARILMWIVGRDLTMKFMKGMKEKRGFKNSRIQELRDSRILDFCLENGGGTTL